MISSAAGRSADAQIRISNLRVRRKSAPFSDIQRRSTSDVPISLLMSTSAITPAQPSRGRRCEACALPGDLRAHIETALAEGRSFSHVSRIAGAPSRDAIRRHVMNGHVNPEIADAVSRSHGLDVVSVAGRLADATTRAREAGLVALEAGDAALALRAIDVEVRTLGVLSNMGVEREIDADLALKARHVAHATIQLVRDDPTQAEPLAAELDRIYSSDMAADIRDIADEVREHSPEFRNEIS